MKKLNENDRRNMIECFINNRICLVQNYVANKQLPKYIANNMIEQLELALEQSMNGFYQDANASLIAYKNYILIMLMVCTVLINLQ